MILSSILAHVIDVFASTMRPRCRVICGLEIIYKFNAPITVCLTHWGRVTHSCVSKLTITDSDNGLSPGRRQAIIWTNAGILLIGPLGKNFSEILIEIYTFSFKKIHLKVSSGKWRPSCLGLNVFKDWHEAFPFPIPGFCVSCYVLQRRRIFWVVLFLLVIYVPIFPLHTTLQWESTADS